MGVQFIYGEPDAHTVRSEGGRGGRMGGVKERRETC